MAKELKQLTKRADNYSQWYNDLVTKADLAEQAPVRGCMIIKPAGYAIWENIQKDWRSRVTDEDIVFIVGDISWALRLEQALFDLQEIMALPGQKYMIRGNHDIGTIAQTIEKYFPELVSENTVKPETVPNPEAFEKVEKDGETYILVKEVDYSKMSVLAIEGIKLLKAEIDELREKLLFTNLD